MLKLKIWNVENVEQRVLLRQAGRFFLGGSVAAAAMVAVAEPWRAGATGTEARQNTGKRAGGGARRRGEAWSSREGGGAYGEEES